MLLIGFYCLILVITLTPNVFSCFSLGSSHTTHDDLAGQDKKSNIQGEIQDQILHNVLFLSKK